MTRLLRKFCVTARSYMKDDKNEKIFFEWVEKAGEDLLSLESLLKHKDGSPSTGCFLAQQAIEKLLKALIIKHGDELEKIHDLTALLQRIRKFESKIEQFSKEIAVVTHYYIETRYPGDYPEFTWEECQKAFEIAKEVKDFVKGKED